MLEIVKSGATMGTVLTSEGAAMEKMIVGIIQMKIWRAVSKYAVISLMIIKVDERGVTLSPSSAICMM